MSIFAISDPHLGFGVNKPMSIFGARWQDHERKLAGHWREVVKPSDTMIIPGDISWGMRLDDALEDLRFLDCLPGRKILLQGNHDYWWASIRKLEQFCHAEKLMTISFLHNNGYLVPSEGIICGTRGWILPDDPEFSSADRKIYEREAGRLRLSLEMAATLRQPGLKLIAGLHFPPFGTDGQPTLFTKLLSAYGVDSCVYGHIHSCTANNKPPEHTGEVSYHLVSADYLDFKPFRL